jgi:hypothetical protein
MYEYKIRDPELRKLAQRSAADEALDAVSSSASRCAGRSPTPATSMVRRLCAS